MEAHKITSTVVKLSGGKAVEIKALVEPGQTLHWKLASKDRRKFGLSIVFQLGNKADHILTPDQKAISVAGRFMAGSTKGSLVFKLKDEAIGLFSSTLIRFKCGVVDTNVSEAIQCIDFHQRLKSVLDLQDSFDACESVKDALGKALKFHSPAHDAASRCMLEQGVSLKSKVFRGYLHEKPPAKTHRVAQHLDSAYGRLNVHFSSTANSGEVISV